MPEWVELIILMLTSSGAVSVVVSVIVTYVADKLRLKNQARWDDAAVRSATMRKHYNQMADLVRTVGAIKANMYNGLPYEYREGRIHQSMVDLEARVIHSNDDNLMLVFSKFKVAVYDDGEWQTPDKAETQSKLDALILQKLDELDTEKR